jgi:hypothetical protein
MYRASEFSGALFFCRKWCARSILAESGFTGFGDGQDFLGLPTRIFLSLFQACGNSVYALFLPFISLLERVISQGSLWEK